jgi:hypothetical protein
VKGIQPLPRPGHRPNEKPGEKDAAAEPDRFEVPPGKAVLLSWSVIGAEKLELKNGMSSLFKSGCHPLPAQYNINPDQDAALTLKAWDRAGNTREKTIKINILQKTK